MTQVFISHIDLTLLVAMVTENGRFVYMSLFNVMYVLCRGRAVTNVGKTCGPTPCLMLAINTFKLNYILKCIRRGTE